MTDLEKKTIIPHETDQLGSRQQINTVDQLTRFNPRPHTVNYLVNMSTRYRYLYIETPKVACSTVKRTLQTLEISGHDRVLPKNVHDKQASPLLSPRDDMAAFEIALVSSHYVRFSFVRNPFGRILSCYLDKFVMNQWERNWRLPMLGFKPTAQISLLEFLKKIERQSYREMDIHWMPQTFILSRKTIDYTVIGRFESFDEDFARVMSQIQGYDVNQIGNHTVHATQATKKVRQYIGPEEKKIILKLYEQDFDEFGYSTDEQTV